MEAGRDAGSRAKYSLCSSIKPSNGLKKGYRHIRAWRLAVFFRTGNRCYLDWQLANKGTDSLTSHFVLAYQFRVW
jgi:hypothetical protein